MYSKVYIATLISDFKTEILAYEKRKELSALSTP